MSERFGEIRSVLNRGESAEGWTQLCDLVDGFEAGELDQMVFPYVAGHVRGWDPRLCVAPREWVYRTLAGEELPFWSMVRMLDLSQEYLNSEQLHTLLVSDRMQGIEVINLESNRVGAAGAQMLAEAEHLGALRELRLGFNHLKVAGMLWLNRAEVLSGLHQLYLEDNSLKDVGLKALCKAPWLGQLETLVISNNECEAASMGELFTRLGETGALRRLVCDRNTLSKGQRAMSTLASRLGQLETLELRGCALGDEEVQVLAREGRWHHVKTLDLSRNAAVTASALRELLGQGEFHALERVYMGGTRANATLSGVLEALPSLVYVELPWGQGTQPGSGTYGKGYEALRERGVKVILAG